MIDELKRFPEAINAAYPKCEIQLCIIHQIRNSLKPVTSRLKRIYGRFKRSLSHFLQETAEAKLVRLADKRAKCQAAIKP